MGSFLAKPAPKRVHKQLHVAPLSLVHVEANDALYKSSGGCSSGIYLAHIHTPSAMQQAGIVADSFITEVDGVKIDSFGYGRTADFLQNPIPYSSILKSKPNLETSIAVTTCQNGTSSNHTVRMEWRESLSFGIKPIDEPYFQQPDLEFEFMGDVMVMQMTTNHISEIVKEAPGTAVSRWLVPTERKKAHLMIVFVTPGSYADRVLMRGMVVSKINGHPVTTLAQWRDPHILDSAGAFWKLETDLGIVYKTEYVPALQKQLEMAMLDPMYAFMMTDGFKAAVKRKIPKVVENTEDAEKAAAVGADKRQGEDGTPTDAQAGTKAVSLGQSGENLSETSSSEAVNDKQDDVLAGTIPFSRVASDEGSTSSVQSASTESSSAAVIAKTSDAGSEVADASLNGTVAVLQKGSALQTDATKEEPVNPPAEVAESETLIDTLTESSSVLQTNSQTFQQADDSQATTADADISLIRPPRQKLADHGGLALL
jgi:hypothetical protein